VHKGAWLLLRSGNDAMRYYAHRQGETYIVVASPPQIFLYTEPRVLFFSCTASVQILESVLLEGGITIHMLYVTKHSPDSAYRTFKISHICIVEGSMSSHAINRARVRILPPPAVECNPGHVPLSPSSIIWYQPMGGEPVIPCGWEGNHRSGVALATRHRH